MYERPIHPPVNRLFDVPLLHAVREENDTVRRKIGSATFLNVELEIDADENVLVLDMTDSGPRHSRRNRGCMDLPTHIHARSRRRRASHETSRPQSILISVGT